MAMVLAAEGAARGKAPVPTRMNRKVRFDRLRYEWAERPLVVRVEPRVLR